MFGFKIHDNIDVTEYISLIRREKWYQDLNNNLPVTMTLP